MKNDVFRHKSYVALGSIVVAMVFALFTVMSFTASAHTQDTQASQPHKVISPPSGRAMSHGHALTQSARPHEVHAALTGRAVLNWNAQTKVLTVAVYVSGLQPNSSHSAHIHQGICSPREGNILYTLNNIVANAAGNGTSVTTFSNVANGIPAGGWNVAVHSGPTAQTGAILCGNVVNPQKATTVSTTLGALPVTR